MFGFGYDLSGLLFLANYFHGVCWLVLRSTVTYWPVIIKTTEMIIRSGCYRTRLERTLRGPVFLYCLKAGRLNQLTPQLSAPALSWRFALLPDVCVGMLSRHRLLE